MILSGVFYSEKKELEIELKKRRERELREEASKAEKVSRMLEESNKPVPCEECKCLINKQESYKVLAQVRYPNYLCDSGYEYNFCQKCKPNYTRIESKLFNDSSSVNKYFKELEVTEKGEPVGYKKDK